LNDVNSHTQKTKPLNGLPENQILSVLHAIADGIIVQNAYGKLIFANQAAATLMGFDNPQELINTSTEEILDRFEIQDEFGQPLNTEWLPGPLALKGEPEPSSMIRYRTDGASTYRWASVKARSVLDGEGQVTMVVSLIQDITETKWVERYQNFLAQVGETLSTSLDYNATLNKVAELAIDQLADWCTINVLDEENTLQLIAIAHTDQEMIALAQDLQNRYPPDLQAATGVARVIRTGKAEFYPHVSVTALKEVAHDDEHLQMLKKLGINSVIILPLKVRERTLGALSLIWAESGRKYNNTDVIMAKELARRASLAIDKARMYRESQDLNEELEVRVVNRTEQLRSLIGTLRGEIEERKKTTQELREKETILNALFESAPDGQVLVKEDGSIVRVNVQIENLFGYTREELVGRPVEILLHDRLQSQHKNQRLEFMSEPRRRSMGSGKNLFGKRKDGSQFPIDITLSPVKTPSENLVIASVRDISDRVQVEAELAEVQRRLLENVEAERLSLAQELHDGPIQDLYGITYSLKEMGESLNTSLDSQSMNGLLSEAEDSVNRVINTLRATCGELRPPSLAPFGLEKAIQAHIDTLQQAHPDLEIELDLMPDGQTLPERTRLALYRIYQNAVSNVIRHAEASRLAVRMGLDEQQVQLEIEDNGRGFQLPNRWVELVRQGHMGLVGAHERVKAINGNLNIDSAPGEGTRIRVTIPRDV
jgi:PAS domain S-box-containing protein